MLSLSQFVVRLTKLSCILVLIVRINFWSKWSESSLIDNSVCSRHIFVTPKQTSLN